MTISSDVRNDPEVTAAISDYESGGITLNVLLNIIADVAEENGNTQPRPTLLDDAMYTVQEALPNRTEFPDLIQLDVDDPGIPATEDEDTGGVAVSAEEAAAAGLIVPSQEEEAAQIATQTGAQEAAQVNQNPEEGFERELLPDVVFADYLRKRLPGFGSATPFVQSALRRPFQNLHSKFLLSTPGMAFDPENPNVPGIRFADFLNDPSLQPDSGRFRAGIRDLVDTLGKDPLSLGRAGTALQQTFGQSPGLGQINANALALAQQGASEGVTPSLQGSFQSAIRRLARLFEERYPERVGGSQGFLGHLRERGFFGA